jgi:hypothetical protein
MRCEVCHGVVLSLEEERTPREVTEIDRTTGAVRTYVVRCCEKCASHIGEKPKR